jgi:peptidoglycan/LPS O-acetylase OafA/YrhL
LKPVYYICTMAFKDCAEISPANNFTALRFILAFTVLLCHLSELSHVPAFHVFDVYLSSQIAIHGFFVISGFLIYRSYLRQPDIKPYLSKRIRRILPAYLAVVVICILGLAALSSLSVHDYFLSHDLWKYTLANVFTLNFLQPELPGVFTNNLHLAVNGSLWTIKLELAFYLTLPLLVIVLKKIRIAYVPWIFVLLYVISSAYVELCEYLYSQSRLTIYEFLQRQLPGKFYYFLSGMILFYFFETFKKYASVFFIFSLPLFIAALTFHLHWLVPLPLAVVIIYLALFTPPVFRKLDHHDYSYGIYLWHFPIIQVFIALHWFDKNLWMMFIVLITCITAVAALSWYTLELSFIRKK